MPCGTRELSTLYRSRFPCTLCEANRTILLKRRSVWLSRSSNTVADTVPWIGIRACVALPGAVDGRPRIDVICAVVRTWFAESGMPGRFLYDALTRTSYGSG